MTEKLQSDVASLTSKFAVPVVQPSCTTAATVENGQRYGATGNSNEDRATSQQAAEADRVAAADDAAIERVDQMLDRIEELGEALDCSPAADDFVVEPLDYELPAKFKLSVIIPVYNEERTIDEILRRVLALPVPKELVVVDDHSTDSTCSRLARWQHHPDVCVIYKPQNAGKGAALRTGFRWASGTIVVVQDADLEYDPRDIPRLLKPIIDGSADVVYGSRFLHDRPQDPSRLHRWGNGLLTWSSNRLSGLRLTDMETCYKAFRRDVLGGLEIRQDRFGFEPEVTAKLARRGCRFSEVPIRYAARNYADGKKIGLRDALNAFYCIVRYGLAD